MEEEAVLRAKAEEKVNKGILPQRVADRLWGGPGVGEPCAVCEQPVAKAEIEFEVQFAKDGGGPLDVFHVHTRCYALWELVRTDGAGADDERSESPR
jgi:hypothetical protein